MGFGEHRRVATIPGVENWRAAISSVPSFLWSREEETASGCPCLEFLEQGKVLCSPVVSTQSSGAGEVSSSSSWEFLEQGRVLWPPLFSRRAPLHSSLLPLSFGLNRALCTIWIMLTIAYLEPLFSPVSLLPSLLPFPSPFSPPEGWAGLLAASWLWCWLLLEPKPVLCPIKVP